MSSTKLTDPTDAILALFAEDLAHIKFPDVDAASLAAAAHAVESARAAVTAREAELEAARAAAAAAMESLRAQAARALAYAQVFAESDPALRAKVAEIAAAERGPAMDATPASAPRRRGRPRKTPPPELQADAA